MTNLTASRQTSFFCKGLQILSWNGWMKPPHPSHPGMFWQLLCWNILNWWFVLFFCVTFFFFTEKKVTILLLLNFHTRQWAGCE
jgi:hypothetical protein